jgi:polysaccharide export outer membrane protein
MKLLALLFVLTCLACSPVHADDQLHVHSQYRLHPGDTLSLEYRLSPELNQTVTIGPDGFVDLSVAGNLKLSGLSLQEAHDLIIQRASVRLNTPELNLQLKDFQHPYVMVAGQVILPGKIEMREDMTALQAIMLAGGFKDSARETKIVVFRRLSGNSGMAEVRQLNLHRIHKTKQLEQDLSLEAGDIVYIPENMATQFSKFMRIPNFSASAGVPAF